MYNVYRNGHSMLALGTPESIGSKDDVLLLSETEICHSDRIVICLGTLPAV